MALEAPGSEVDICNLALSHLKQRAIVQLDPTTSDTEEICALWYQLVRRSTLRLHPWNFAMGRAEVLPDGTYTPEFGFTHAYQKPTDFIRLIGFYDDEGNRIHGRGSENDFDLENDYILYNGEDATAINIRYIMDITDVNKMDPLFIDLFALDLAIRLAPRFTGGEARVKTLASLRTEVYTAATAIDGQERPPRRVQRSRFIEARTRGGNVAGKYTRFSNG
jgi:hypothetical protein